MLRYIKVNNEWIDTLADQRDFHIVYTLIDGKIYAIIDNGDDVVTGLLQAESDKLEKEYE